MKVKKNKIILSGIALLTLITFASITNTQIIGKKTTDNQITNTQTADKKTTDKQIVNLSAKLENIESLKEMESKSVLIVKGKKTKLIDQIQHQDPDTKEVIDQYSISNIKITEVFQDKTKQNFKQGENIVIRENSWIEDGVTYQVEGYQLMKNNNEYLLFLGENNKSDYFYPRGVIYGKVELNNPSEMSNESISNSANSIANDSTIIAFLGETPFLSPY